MNILDAQLEKESLVEQRDGIAGASEKIARRRARRAARKTVGGGIPNVSKSPKIPKDVLRLRKREREIHQKYDRKNASDLMKRYAGGQKLPSDYHPTGGESRLSASKLRLRKAAFTKGAKAMREIEKAGKIKNAGFRERYNRLEMQGKGRGAGGNNIYANATLARLERVRLKRVAKGKSGDRFLKTQEEIVNHSVRPNLLRKIIRKSGGNYE